MVGDQTNYVRKIVRAKIAALKDCPTEDEALFAIFSELMSTQLPDSRDGRILQNFAEEILIDLDQTVDRIRS